MKITALKEKLAGILFGILIGIILFVIPSDVLNDRIKILLSIVVGLIIPNTIFQKLDRPIKTFSIWMVCTLVLFILTVIVVMLVKRA